MNRIATVFIAAVLVFSACKPKSKNINEKNTVDDTGIADYTKILGSYAGTFGKYNITLLISKSVKDTVEGRAIIAGNDNPIKGTVLYKEGTYKITAQEINDGSYKGVYELLLDEHKDTIINGSWKPLRHDAGGAEDQNLSLRRNPFVYRIDVGFFPQSSQRLLKDDDVANLMKDELETMRNEIFARHGYCFTRKANRDQFEINDWYIPHSVDVRKDLTEIEKKNIVFIKRYEKYAAEYGDDFGR